MRADLAVGSDSETKHAEFVEISAPIERRSFLYAKMKLTVPFILRIGMNDSERCRSQTVNSESQGTETTFPY